MNVLGKVPSGHMYVDESTAKRYLVMCAVIPSGDVAHTRTAMTRLLLRGQKSLHMKDEKKRASDILGAIVKLNPQVLILGCPQTDKGARAAGCGLRYATVPVRAPQASRGAPAVDR